MAVFGDPVASNIVLNEVRFDNADVSKGLSIPIVEDISNPPQGFRFAQRGIYFDNTTEKIYLYTTSGVLEEVSSAIPGAGGGTIQGASNLIVSPGDTPIFDSIINGGITLQFKSLASTDTITPSINGDGNVDLGVIGSPALRIGGVNYTIPTTATDGQVLTWDNTTPGLEWTTPTSGSGTITGGVNTSSGPGIVGPFDSIVGGNTLRFRSLITTDTISPSVNGGGDIDLGVIGSPALRFDNTNYTIPNGPLDGQVLSWNNTSSQLEWTTPASGGGGSTQNTSDILDVTFVTFKRIDLSLTGASLTADVRDACVPTSSGGFPGDGAIVLARNQTTVSENGVYVLQTLGNTFTRVPGSVFSGQIYNVTASAVEQRAYFVEGTGDIDIGTDDIIISPYKGLLRSEIRNIYGFGSYQNTSSQGPFGSSTVQGIITFYQNTLINGSGGFPFATNISIINPSTDPGDEFTYFQNISGEDRLWNVSANVYATTTSPEVFELLELFVVIGGPFITNTLSPFTFTPIGLNRKLHSAQDEEYITINTNILVPEDQYVCIGVTASVSNGIQWTIGDSSNNSTSVTITELPN